MKLKFLALVCLFAWAATPAQACDGLTVMLYDGAKVIDHDCLPHSDGRPVRYHITMRIYSSENGHFAPVSGVTWLSRMLPLPGTNISRLEAGFVVRPVPERGLTSIQWQVRRSGADKRNGGDLRVAPAHARWNDQGTALLLPHETFEVPVPDATSRLRISLEDPL